jgi:hypothetical protein
MWSTWLLLEGVVVVEIISTGAVPEVVVPEVCLLDFLA